MQTEINYLQILQYVSLKPTSSLNYPKWPQLPTITLSPGGGGYSHILIIWVYATVQGIIFKPFCQEQGIENTLFRSGTGCQIEASLE